MWLKNLIKQVEGDVEYPVPLSMTTAGREVEGSIRVEEESEKVE